MKKLKNIVSNFFVKNNNLKKIGRNAEKACISFSICI